MPPTFPEFAGDVWKHAAAVGRPISEQHLNKRKVPAETVRAQFLKTNEHVGNETDNFPKRITYPGRCGALCRTAATQQVWRTYQRLQQLLAQFCQELGKPVSIPLLDVVLRGETIGANGEHIHASHVYLASCGGQAGLIQARQNLIALNVVAQHEHDGENCTLRLSREDFIEPRHQTCVIHSMSCQSLGSDL